MLPSSRDASGVPREAIDACDAARLRGPLMTVRCRCAKTGIASLGGAMPFTQGGDKRSIALGKGNHASS
jgi:hypothetical protein